MNFPFGSHFRERSTDLGHGCLWSQWRLGLLKMTLHYSNCLFLVGFSPVFCGVCMCVCAPWGEHIHTADCLNYRSVQPSKMSVVSCDARWHSLSATEILSDYPKHPHFWNAADFLHGVCDPGKPYVMGIKCATRILIQVIFELVGTFFVRKTAYESY